VLLPVNSPEEPDCSGFPSRRDEPADVFDKDLWIKLISVITAAPALLTVTIDYLMGNGIDWSLYILYVLGLVWVWCSSPFLFKRNIFPLWFAIDAAALIGFLFLVEWTSGTGNWAMPLAIPIAVMVAAIIFTLVSTFRRKIVRQLQKPALIFLLVAVLCLFIEVFADLYRANQYRPGWSVLVAIPCLTFAVILLILQRRQWIVEELRHWLRY
jgi:ABC-type xylose transport system permease subunit